MKYFFFIFSLSLFLSCSDNKPNDSNTKKSNNTEFSDKENLAQSDNENVNSLDSYLIISALYEDFPSSKGANNEINWPSDSLTKRFSRKYVQLDELIEGRRVFSDTSGEQFFFYFPHNKCWMLHSEFPNEEVLNTLKKSIGGSFSDMISKNESYRFGFEYGETDSWNLEKLAFSQSPWNYSSSENFVNNLDSDAEGYQTSMYEVKWVGADPMVALKANWIKKQKTKRYDDWVAAYERYIDAPNDNLFVPKPIPIDYRIALKDPISDFDGFGVLRAYFIDQYKFIDVVLDTEDVYIENDRISQFVTFNSKGDRIMAPEYSNGSEMAIKTSGDSVILPWINSSTENFGSGISYTTNYISYQRLMDDKMWDGGQSFNLPNLDTKYVMTLLEFLFGDTFVFHVSEGNTQYVERVYTMPEDPKRDLPLETGCWFEVSKTGIEFMCDRGGC